MDINDWKLVHKESLMLFEVMLYELLLVYGDLFTSNIDPKSYYSSQNNQKSKADEAEVGSPGEDPIKE